MAGQLEGIIVLSADGRPIVHSHFANHIPSYPLLHTDYFGTLLAGINAANAQVTSLNHLGPSSSSSSTSRNPAAASTSATGEFHDWTSNKVYLSKDIKPVLWVPGIPDVNPIQLNIQEDDEEEEPSEDEDDPDNVGELSLASQLSARIRNGTSSSSNAARIQTDDETNVWNDEQESSTAAASTSILPSLPHSSAGTVPSSAHAARGNAVVNSASEVLAEQGASLIHVSSGSLRFLCPVSREIDPLVPLTFLRSFIAILQEYLAQSTDPTQLTEDVLRDHFDIVYQLFEEILDTDGNILTTEVNLLKSLVLPPNWVGKLVKAVGVSGLASAAPPPLISPIPWRRPNSKYTNNEMYVDLIESLEGIISKSGRAISLDVWGKVECNARLSGTPDLCLSFNHPDLIQDESFHPCVRHKIWRRDKMLSFVPPDGQFELLGFRVGDPFLASSIHGDSRPTHHAGSPLNGWSKNVPITVTHAIELGKGTGEVCIQVQASGLNHSNSSFSGGSSVSSSSSGGAGVVEDVVVTFGLGPGVVTFEASVGGGIASSGGNAQSAGLTTSITPSVSTTPEMYGTYIYDPATRIVRWSIPRLHATSPSTSSLTSSSSNPNETSRPALLKLNWTTSNPTQTPSLSTAITTTFILPTNNFSGLKVSNITLTNQNTHPYRPFKGVRSFAKSKLVWRV